MFVICDQNGIVQDIASEKINLSRGYDFTGYKLFELNIPDLKIGDTYKDGVYTKNQVIRDQLLTGGQNEKKIQERVRKIAIDQLKAEGKLPADYTE